MLHLNELAERFGLVMAEAMGAGVPVIAMDNGSCREVVAHGKAGYLVNSVDEAVEWLKHIEKISPADCRKHVEDNFSIESMVKAYEKVYDTIFEIEEK